MLITQNSCIWALSLIRVNVRYELLSGCFFHTQGKMKRKYKKEFFKCNYRVKISIY